MAFAVVRAMLWPQMFMPRVVLEVSYRLIAMAAAFQLIRYRWGRGEIGPWLLAFSLLLLHLEWAPLNVLMPLSLGMMADLILGMSMLLVVFDDSKMRTRRLAVINALTTTITRSQQHGPMMATALEELKGLMRAKAAWFRLLEGDKLVIAQQIGLSPEFLRDRSLIPVDKAVEEVLRDGVPTVIKTKAASDAMRPYYEEEGFNHVVMVPVLGKKSRHRDWLTWAAGAAFLRSRRIGVSRLPALISLGSRWKTCDWWSRYCVRIGSGAIRSIRFRTWCCCTIPNFRVMKANHALLQRLGTGALRRGRATRARQSCPAIAENGQACPYCEDAEEAFCEGADPCFGGFSMVSTSSYTEQNSNQTWHHSRGPRYHRPPRRRREISPALRAGAGRRFRRHAGWQAARLQ